MGKILMYFCIHNDSGDVISKITFDSLEQIDLCIEKLQEARAAFEHRIEMKKQKMCEKRKRKKMNNINIYEKDKEDLRKSYHELLDIYEEMPDGLKGAFKGLMDMTTEILNDVLNRSKK